MNKPRAITLLITGFGSFPGAPVNPSARLVARLMRVRRPALDDVRRVSHVFATTYAAVDRDLPALLAREKPHTVLMLGVATRAKRIRIETLAHNRRLVLFPDAAGVRPQRATIALNVPFGLRVRSSAIPLLAAARALGDRVNLSRNAGAYLCNYALWRGLEAQTAKAGPSHVVFVHVPPTALKARPLRRGKSAKPLTLTAMARTLEAIMMAFVAQTKRAARIPPRS